MEKSKLTLKRSKPKARTEDVLGRQLVGPRTPGKWREHYQRLVELREAMRSRQADLAKDALEENPNFSTHVADAATDTYDRDFALCMLSSEQDAVYEIEEALDRINHGSYGICEVTGKPIEPSRLAAIPWTRFSAEAEKQLEKDGAVKVSRLGRRETVTERGQGESGGGQGESGDQ